MFSAFFIDRPKFAFVIAIVTVLAGLLALLRLPVAEYPELTPPQVQVSANYPGANAGVVEETVAAVIEAEVNGVEDMIYMSSKSANDGSYTLTVTFEVGTDGDLAQVNVQNRVSLATPKLPEDVTRQGISVTKQSTSMLQVISVYSPNGTYDDHLPVQLHQHQHPRHAGARGGRGPRGYSGRTRLLHAHLAAARSADQPRPDRRRRDQRHPRPERAGLARQHRPAAGAVGPAVPVHPSRPRGG